MKKIALVISGAVSLGTYEAGVVFELVNAFKFHNKYEPDPKRQFQIDVITVASAGAMTAAILARSLLFEATSFNSKNSDNLYDVWVKQIDIEKLLKMGPGDSATKSIFSSSLITKMSEQYISQPIGRGTIHPASASTIRVGMALSNLNGVSYGEPTSPGGKFVYTQFQDQICREIDSKDPSQTNWDELRQAAVSSGAFPIAFAARDLKRPKDSSRNNLIQHVFMNRCFSLNPKSQNVFCIRLFVDSS